jgi:hypothetical protein
VKYRNWVSELDKREYLVIFEFALAVGDLEAVEAPIERKGRNTRTPRGYGRLDP